jgi:hypothetical protein
MGDPLFRSRAKESVESDYSHSWLHSFDWDLVAYLIACVGSVLYFLQGIYIYAEPNSTYYFQCIASLIAAVIFVISSLLYHVGWMVHRSFLSPNELLKYPMFEDYNLFGNIVFIVGSVGYMFPSVYYLKDEYPQATKILNFLLAILFIIDAILYFIALTDENQLITDIETNSSEDKIADVDWCTVDSYRFHDDFDWYFLATLLFLLGSVVYLIAAILDLYSKSPVTANFIAAVVFLFDSPFYVASGLQKRNGNEVAFWKRKNYFYIEDESPKKRDIKGNENSPLLQKQSS